MPNKKVVHRYIDEVVNQGHYDRIPELLAPQFLLHFPGYASAVERASLPAFLGKIHNAFPDFHLHVHDLVAEGEHVVAIVAQTGTHQGEYLGAPATGKTFEVPMQIVYRIWDGKITDSHPLFDRLEILEQLGVWHRPRP